MLEDDFTYVFRKALMSRGLAPGEAAAKAGVPEAAAMGLLRGDFSAEVARCIAPVIGLNAAAFSRHNVYQPQPLALPGVERLDLPFGGERVNAWLLRAGDDVLLFDAGFEPSDLRRELDRRCGPGRLPDRVFITHAHRDHIGALEGFVSAGIPVHAPALPSTVNMKPGDAVLCGPLTVTACDLRGHASPALGYRIDGLEKPALVTGDALFAGSIGGCPSPEVYRQALAKLLEALAGLPDETVLLPGHGPATTIAEERLSNPFL